MLLRPLASDHLDALAAMIAAPGVREWWGAADDGDRVRADLQDYSWAFVIEEAGEIAGWIGVDEERDWFYPSAALDIVIGPGHQDRGLGSEALRVVIDWLVGERGHHRITIDPAVENERAIRCYEAVGFRRVGVMEAYERRDDGSWRDGLLMELVRPKR